MSMGAGMDDYISNITNITLPQMETAALVRGVTSMVGLVLCSLTLLFELVWIYRYHGKKTSVIQRLFVYLTVSTLASLGAQSLSIEHYFRYDLFHQARVCIAVGFLVQYTASVQLIFVLGATMLLFYKVCYFCSNGINLNQGGKCLEISFCVAAILLPLVFLWIPFLHLGDTGGVYGPSGPHCWIVSRDLDTCKEFIRGVLEQIFMWYAPNGVVSAICFLCIIFVLVFFCYLRYNKRILLCQTSAIITEMLLLLLFLFTYATAAALQCVLYGLLGLEAYGMDVYPLWVANAVILPIGFMSVPIGFFTYLVSSKRCVSSRYVSDYEVSSDCLQTGDYLIHHPSRVSMPSHTSDRGCNFLSKSHEYSSS